MLATSIRVTQPRLLKETAQTLRKLGLSISSSSSSSPLTITPYPSSGSSHFPGKVGQSHPTVPPLLVPTSTSPARNLSLLRKLAASAPGPFFATGKAGQINAALFAAACLAPTHPKIRRALHLFRSRQTQSVPQKP
jgi:phosphoribosylcarboxyaminoimidazole (NCAIR) mutase